MAETPASRIDVIKIDVEGAELRALRGAAATLQRYRPILIFEVSETSLRNQGATPEEVVEFVRAQGYAIHVFDRATGLAVPAPTAARSENMIGVPHGKPLPDSTRLPWPAR